MIESAGIVVVDFSEQEPKALCLLSGFKQWDFPKGHVESGESRIEAALRETVEECGLTMEDFKMSNEHASTVPYRVPSGFKVATYYFAERTSKKVPFLPINPELGKPEHISWKWTPISSLYDRMPKRLHPIVDSLLIWASKS